jgi:purine-cytosine permease-like protein
MRMIRMRRWDKRSGIRFDGLAQATAIGNVINFVSAALVGYIGYRTGCTSGLLYRIVFGGEGAKMPALA